MISETS